MSKQAELFQRPLISHRATRRPAPAAVQDPEPNPTTRPSRRMRIMVRKPKAAKFRAEVVAAVLDCFKPGGGSPHFGSFLWLSAGGCVGDIS